MTQPQSKIEEDTITICAIPAHLLRVKAELPDGTRASVADRVSSFLWRACKHAHGQQSPQTLLDGIASGEDALLLALEDNKPLGCAVITKQVFPTGKSSVFIRVVSGDRFDDWRDKMVTEIERIAVDLECSSVITCGRLGWMRKHSDMVGYKPIHTTFEKQLQNP